ncbi:MAG TPA: BTAD domain-containing putative transcriptional regulator [Gemmatimonadales bacterium]|nr:BTAD domain-containing putative transcriptional regulator [Gemmatimonadales bacterium]
MKAPPIFHLRLLGSPSLESDSGPAPTRATQRHRVGLLALLGVSPGQRLTRDHLIATLWPERDTEGGRNLLKVSTYVLRESLSETALLSEGDFLRLNSEVVRTDVVGFEAAVSRGDHPAAVALYRGPLLDGFYLGEAPEFEHWVDRERQRLASLYGRSLEALAQAAEGDRDFQRAVEWWTRRAELDRYDSRVAARLIQALDASGNRAGALQHAAVHQRLLEHELGVASVPEVAGLADRLRREARVPEAVAAAKAEAEVAPERFLAPRDSRLVSRQRWAWAAGVALLAVGASAAWSRWSRPADPDASIVVLPFVNLSAEENNEYFSDGLTEEITARLAAVPGLKVISRTSAMHYKGTSRPLREIAGELKVAHVLEGSVRQSEGRLRISAQLIDARSDQHLWADQLELELKDAFRAQEEIADQVARKLEIELGGKAGAVIAKRGTHDHEAFMLYRRGRFLWSRRDREGHARALEYYERAIARDSGYADAYAGMADIYLTAFQHKLIDLPESELSARQKLAAERAIALDDHSADAHTAFAVALWWRRDWRGAERELRRAIELNPGHPDAHGWYALLLTGMGRSAEALAQSRQDAEMDPMTGESLANLGHHCWFNRDYDCAVDRLRLAIEVGNYVPGYALLGVAFALKGRYDEAIRSVRRGIEIAPERTEFLGDLAYAQAKGGDTAVARQTLRLASAQPREPFTIARAWVALGDADSAFVWLDRSSWLWPHRAALVDPALDPIRSDPRFAKLSERIEREMGLR